MVPLLQNIKNKIEIQHNMTHAPDAFSSLRSREGAGDARRYKLFGLLFIVMYVTVM